MSAAGIGAVAWGALGGISSIIGLRAENKAVISSIKREGASLISSIRQINFNREQLDRELGDILSASALETAKQMSTAKVIMSTSGTAGGTTKQVAKQAHMDAILREADIIAKARNQEIGLLGQALQKRIDFKNRAESYRSQIKSPLEATLGTLTAIVSGATGGASMGSSFGTKSSNIGASSIEPSNFAWQPFTNSTDAGF